MKVTYRKPQGKKAGRWLVQCQCGYDCNTGCKSRLEIYNFGEISRLDESNPEDSSEHKEFELLFWCEHLTA